MNCFKELIIVFIIITLFSCDTQHNSQENSELDKHLSTSLVENPRSLHDDTLALKELGKLVFTDTTHDFGIIKEDEIVEYEFEFRNEGIKDILISEAKASCGCTVPVYPQQPIKGGEKNKIKVTFNSQGKKGYNDKLILVSTNGNPAMYHLHIIAEVLEK